MKNKFLQFVLTGKDNETYEIVRVLLFFGFLSFVVFSAFDVFVAHHFDPLSYSAGLTGLLFGGAGGIALKAGSEPEVRGKEDV